VWDNLFRDQPKLRSGAERGTAIRRIVVNPVLDAEVQRLSHSLRSRAHEEWGRDLSEENKFYVYVLQDGRKPGRFVYDLMGTKLVFRYEPFYVGKGNGRRKDNHVSEALRGRSKNPFKENKIRRILAAHADVLSKRVTSLIPEAESLVKEKLLIQAIGRGKCGPLTNLSDGGEGASGAVRTELTRLKQREAALKRTARYAHAPETRRRMSETHRKLPFLRCVHCGAENTASNIAQHHNDNCKEAPHNKGKDLRRRQPQLTCPHCNVTGGAGAIRRWHFDNCRESILCN
jgi:hypothetical protein